MKRFYILIALFCFALSAQAQFGVGGGGPTTTGRISGTIIDSLTKKPMDYASVGLYRSGGKSPITGVVTDEKGNFKLDNIKPGVYKLAISFIGYPTKYIDQVTTTPSKPDAKLGQVLLAPSSHALKEVSVVGQAALIENKIDKIVYNAEKDLTSVGGNATDVLQKVPLVAVDLNGNVSIRGDQNVRVLINGKPSGATSASLSDVLKTIPADQIKSIEVVTSPSAKYDAEGSAGILNIITKQKNVSGISGSISGGVGTRQNNGNANINYNHNRFSLSANAGGNATWPQTSLTSSDQNFNYNDPTKHYEQTSTGTSRVKRHGVIGSVSAGYDFNAYNNLRTSIRLNQGGFDPHSLSTTNQTYYFDHTKDQSYTSDGRGHNSFGGFDWNIDYTHKFKKEGHELDLSAQWSHSKIVTDYTNLYSAVFDSLQNNINGKNNEYTIQADYTLPVSKLLKLEAGGKNIIRRIKSISDYFVPDGNGGFVFSDPNSNRYNYNQTVWAGYTVLTFSLPKGYSIMTGARLENTDIHGEPINSAQNLSPFDQNYNTFIPSLTFQKALTPTQTIKLSYSKRITRPSLQFLNPFVNRSNITAQTVGNPDLAPEISQTVELGYNTFIKSSVINLSAYYKHTSGLIEGIVENLPPNGDQNATLTTYQNIGVNNSYGASFFGSVTPFKILTIRGQINAYTYKPTAIDQFTHQQTQTNTYVQYNAFLSAQLTLPNNFIAEAFAVENSARRTIQGSNPSFSIMGFGFKKQFMQKKLALGINAIEPFNTYKNFNTDIKTPTFTQSSKFAFPFRSFGVTFSYSFGKLSFSNPNQQKKGINNDDMKQGDQGAGGSPTGGR
ncbi:outer membrane receptor protein involved in Fe transport [Mucilaginibacter sp. SG538B]|jgi:outer membrane receptor protein involved in Fe transport|uniref:outer membrane beta-barrel family protein n=1 Tax=Mucilaginibacter sp. SG538B TaxID=2587021 RepID=UPI00159D9549|nr:outer membrane beta-barrel family protein [Mucilaginibacter sp. SG538B]NVM61776.1 outer membrane receptor protein involved in Fe transport [Mucilaginibacter sp. SG538B]